MSARSSDTIVAIATAAGRGGVGIVRLSGTRAGSILEGLFRPNGPFESHRMRHGTIVHDGRVHDDVLAVFFQGPRSYTGEDAAEIFGHGNPVVLDAIVAACVAFGARPAGPGEFTQRAYLNGRLDLVQAEAVADLIHAESRAEAEAARRRLEGRLSEGIGKIYDRLLDVLAECEADVDFPDENLPLAARPALGKAIDAVVLDLENLLGTYDVQRKLREGFSVALIGAPNAGKSSLFNRILQAERAIVTPVAGTTRDVLREEFAIAGRKIRLLDTAGLRDGTDDAIEAIGMERSRAALADADLVLEVVATDGDVVAQGPALEPARHWRIWNKVDLAPPPAATDRRTFGVSAKTGQGVAELTAALAAEVMRQTPSLESGAVANDRQRGLLEGARAGVARGLAAWAGGESAEFAAFEFRLAQRALAELLGRTDPVEDTLDRVFSTFCVGK